MAGSLIKIDEEIVTSAVASVTLGGSDWDSSYDVYMVRVNNWLPDTNNVQPRVRFTASATPDTSANYDYAYKGIRADTTFSNTSSTNQTSILASASTGTAGNESFNGVLYLFNFNNASEYSFITVEQSTRNQAGNLYALTGGGTLTVSQATDGIQFYLDTGNIASGSTFTLYGLKK